MPEKSPLIRPYLKWAGGKRQLLFEIRKHFPPQVDKYTYYEPFLGAGAVFFDLQPKRAVINDFNTQLIITYRVIREQVEELIQALQGHKRMSRERDGERYYYDIRAQDKNRKAFQDATDIEKAARLIFLNKTCYNGLYRVNSQGFFNVPYGKHRNPAICEESILRAIHKYLQANDIVIMNGDFEPAVKNADKQSFVYFDPPYHSPDRANFTGYQAEKFGEAEQIRLRDTFVALTEHGAKCLLSNSDTEFIRGLYRDRQFDIISVQAKRAINSNAAGRGDVNEVLIKNWQR